MEEIKSGKELCDEFFEGLVGIEGVDKVLGDILQQLYEKGQLTTDTVLSTLKDMREGEKNGKQS